ncbi:PPC domain-containing protein [Xanthomonas bromi]|uniref:PPC domain-containing protein n=1 Tax=Xanthomonas bromi TaxID=56449 RepID=UPI001FD7C854|nr:PPC domain-containing protein [Xanthomonas bromi]
MPAGSGTLTVTTSGGSGDADLYVRAGSVPTDGAYNCRPYLDGNTETCSFASPSGTYYVRIKAYSTFSGVTLTASY